VDWSPTGNGGDHLLGGREPETQQTSTIRPQPLPGDCACGQRGSKNQRDGRKGVEPPPTARHYKEAAWIVDQLQASAQAGPILDVACGHGAYAVACATAGTPVIGLDCSAALLRRAVGIAGEAAASVEWMRADYRALPVRSRVAAGSLLRDALGFYDDDASNAEVLREIRRTGDPFTGYSVYQRLAFSFQSRPIVAEATSTPSSPWRQSVCRAAALAVVHRVSAAHSHSG
jgi:ubiquinone/menaquinone biosynthesis C-methylase UbiE